MGAAAVRAARVRPSSQHARASGRHPLVIEVPHRGNYLVAGPCRKVQSRVRRRAGQGESNPVRAILASLGAFAAAGLRPRTPLAKAIMLILLIKLIGVTAMRVYLAADNVEPAVDAATMARVIGVAPPARQP